MNSVWSARIDTGFSSNTTNGFFSLSASGGTPGNQAYFVAPVQLPTTTGRARLELRATRGNSYLVVKSQSSIGTVLYQGTLERGQQQRFEGKVLWLRLESPANVRDFGFIALDAE